MSRIHYALLITVLLQLFTTEGRAQTVFSYGGQAVSKQEFLNAFHKNNPDKKTDAKEIEEYLELYIRYRLKIAWAYRHQLDTLPSVQQEWERFRHQVAGSYLIDDSTLQAMQFEALQRSGTEKEIAHIYIRHGGDTSSANIRLKAALAALKAGHHFEDVAQRFSDDPSVQQNKGNIGWVSVFTLPYELENLAYTTPVNKVSKVYTSPLAFHIFKVLAERPSTGKTSVAQLFLEASAENENLVTKKADSLYQLLQAGTDFSKLASQFSEDNGSYQQGGELPPFSAGSYDPGFEQVVSSLQQPGNFSKPYRSKQGFHIIKLLSRQGIPDTTKEETKEQLRNQLLASDRYKLAAETAFRKASKLTGLKLFPVPENPAPATPIASIGERTITETAFIKYRQQRNQETSTAAGITAARKDFIRQQVMQEYIRNLENYQPDFAAQMKDFKEGTLLFEAMQQQVWDKASLDEKGLENFYLKNAKRYTWNESFRGVLFSCADETTARKLREELSSNPAGWPELLKQYSHTVMADSGRFEYDQLPVSVSPASVNAGELSQPVSINDSEQYGFIYCINKFPANQPRAFEDARGYVLNDFQLHLEEQWISELKKTFPVKLNKSVLNTLNR